MAMDINELPLAELFGELTRGDHLGRLLALARDEDLGSSGDITSAVTISDSARSSAHVVAREAGVLAGGRTIPALLEVFARNVRHELRVEDGGAVERGDVVAVLHGSTRELLALERTMLNLIGRLSGVATRTSAFVRAVQGTGVRLLDIRKTTPGLRALEKYAVRCGGGYCHRLGLFDAVLMKDNHLAGVSLEELPAFVSGALARLTGRDALAFVEVEVDALEQFEALLKAGLCGGRGGVDIVLLDNMTLEQLRQGVAMRKRYGASVLLESSGGVTLETVRAIAETGIDRISVGGLTHHAVWMDVAVDFVS